MTRDQRIVGAVAALRMALGVGSILAPDKTARVFGFPERSWTPMARLLGRWFGVRETHCPGDRAPPRRCGSTGRRLHDYDEVGRRADAGGRLQGVAGLRALAARSRTSMLWRARPARTSTSPIRSWPSTGVLGIVAEMRDREELQFGGPLLASAEIRAQVTDDLRRAELLAFPILFALSLLIFRGLVAALLPLLVGALAVLGTLLALRLAAEFTDLSIFALNLVTGLGLGLAIDYTAP